MSDDKRTLSLNDKKPTDERTARPEQSRDEEVRISAKKPTRRKKVNEQEETYINPVEVPDGFSVEWKRYTVIGKEDHQHMVGLELDGWTFADPKQFPSLVGKSPKGNMVRIKDLVLMIRPKELTDEARYEDRVRAVTQVKQKLEEIGVAGADQAPRRDSAGNSLVKVKTTYDRIPVE